MKPNNMIKQGSIAGRVLRGVLSGAACMALLLTGGCRDYGEHYGLSDNSERHGVLTVDYMLPSVSVVSRAVDFSDDAKVKLNSVWIGVYDAASGRLIGTKTETPAAGTTMTGNHVGKRSVDGIDVYYYGPNPETYIVGVANYENIKARRVGSSELVDLATLLEGATSWNDFHDISIDIASAQAVVNRDPYYPLLAGFFTNSHTAAPAMVRADGGLTDNARIVLTDNVDSGSKGVIRPTGQIHLRRMLSQMTVNIEVLGNEDMGDRYISNFENVRYRVLNNPTEMYLSEHVSDTGGASRTKESDYLSRTANSADYLELAEAGTGYKSTGWQPAAGEFDQQKREGSFKFTYQEYENKHWGRDWRYFDIMPEIPDYDDDDSGIVKPLPPMVMPGNPENITNMTWSELIWAELSAMQGSSGMPADYYQYVVSQFAHPVRESQLGTVGEGDASEPVFRTLCSSIENAYNNKAPYFEIEADVTLEHRSTHAKTVALARYIIHEGFTTNSDGSPATAVSRIRSQSEIRNRFCDYQRIRNTDYTYNVYIVGIDQVRYNVIADYYYDSYYGAPHNDGISGSKQWESLVRDIDPNGNFHPDSVGDTWVDNFEGTGNSNGNFENMMMLPYTFTNYSDAMKSRLKWRFYEVTSDGTVYDFGTWGNTDAEFDWPSTETMINPLDEDIELTDEQEQHLLCMFQDLNLHAARWYSYGYDHAEWRSLRKLNLGDFMDMTVDEFEDIDRYSFCTMTYDRYRCEEDEDFDNLDKYMRAFYIGFEERDEDDCAYGAMVGIRQKPYDKRAVVDDHLIIYHINENSSPMQSYGYSMNVVNSPSAIAWTAAGAWYADDYSENSYGQEWHEAEYYMLQIDNQEPVRIEADGDECCYYYSDWSDDWYYWDDEWNDNNCCYFVYDDIDFGELGIGDHTFTITAYGLDEKHVQPFEPLSGVIHVQEPYWAFDDVTFPNGNLSTSSSTPKTYAGLRIYGAQIFPNNSVDLDSGSFGYIYGSPTNRNAIALTVDSHGTLVVEAGIPTGTNVTRHLRLNHRKEHPTSNSDAGVKYLESEDFNIGDRKTITFDTTDFEDADLFDELGNGEVRELGLYTDYRLYVYSVKWIPNPDAKKSLNGSKLTYRNWSSKPNEDIHPSFYDKQEFFLAQHFASSFSFSDDKHLATSYKIQLYKYRDGYYGSGFDFKNATLDEPVYEVEFDADEYRTFSDEEGANTYGHVFTYPLLIGADAHLTTGEYVIAVVPVGDPNIYRAAKPQPIAAAYFVDWTIPAPGYPGDDYFEDEEGYLGYPAIWGWEMEAFALPGTSLEEGLKPNTIPAHTYWDFAGLHLHGNASVSVSSNDQTTWVTHTGSGYPINTNTGTAGLRNYSLTTDIAGEFLIAARSTSTSKSGNTGTITGRFVHLFKEGEDVAHEEVMYFSSANMSQIEKPLVLKTGDISGPTELVICPENGCSISLILFVPADSPYYDFDYSKDSDGNGEPDGASLLNKMSTMSRQSAAPALSKVQTRRR